MRAKRGLPPRAPRRACPPLALPGCAAAAGCLVWRLVWRGDFADPQPESRPPPRTAFAGAPRPLGPRRIAPRGPAPPAAPGRGGPPARAAGAAVSVSNGIDLDAVQALVGKALEEDDIVTRFERSSRRGLDATLSELEQGYIRSNLTVEAAASGLLSLSDAAGDFSAKDLERLDRCLIDIQKLVDNEGVDVKSASNIFRASVKLLELNKKVTKLISKVANVLARQVSRLSTQNVVALLGSVLYLVEDHPAAEQVIEPALRDLLARADEVATADIVRLIWTCSELGLKGDGLAPLLDALVPRLSEESLREMPVGLLTKAAWAAVNLGVQDADLYGAVRRITVDILRDAIGRNDTVPSRLQDRKLSESPVIAYAMATRRKSGLDPVLMDLLAEYLLQVPKQNFKMMADWSLGAMRMFWPTERSVKKQRYKSKRYKDRQAIIDVDFLLDAEVNARRQTLTMHDMAQVSMGPWRW